MKYSVIAGSLALLGAAGCVQKATEPEAPPTYHLTATITEANQCNVNVLDKSYSSIGQIRGDVPSKFIGTVADKSYHGFGCWVATTGGDGDLIVLFSGNNLGKPLEVGTYTPSLEVLDDTPPMRAQVTFRTSEIGPDKLRTLDTLPGSIVVEATPSGGRIIKVDTQVSRIWGASL
jgi:hypothetical protein